LIGSVRLDWFSATSKGLIGSVQPSWEQKQVFEQRLQHWCAGNNGTMLASKLENVATHKQPVALTKSHHSEKLAGHKNRSKHQLASHLFLLALIPT
jgi:hypothetical protein